MANKSENFQIPAVRDIRRQQIRQNEVSNLKSEIDINLNPNPVVYAFLMIIALVAVLGFLIAFVLR